MASPAYPGTGHAAQRGVSFHDERLDLNHTVHVAVESTRDDTVLLPYVVTWKELRRGNCSRPASGRLIEIKDEEHYRRFLSIVDIPPCETPRTAIFQFPIPELKEPEVVGRILLCNLLQLGQHLQSRRPEVVRYMKEDRGG